MASSSNKQQQQLQDKEPAMNVYGFIDYKKPSPDKQDMRTSSYLGHVYMTDTMLGNESHIKFAEIKPYENDPELEKIRISDYSSNYTWKYPDPSEKHNPTVKGEILYMKPFDECKMRFIKRPLRPAVSVSHQDYIWFRPDPQPTPPQILAMPSAVSIDPISMDPSKPAYTRYLDPSATTTSLAYQYYDTVALMGSSGAKDQITFYNWHKHYHPNKKVFPDRDPQICDKFASLDCPKRRREFINDMRPVPHSGMTTEVRQNYKNPQQIQVECKPGLKRNQFVDYPELPQSKKTETMIIGSGERTDRYV